jgi:hypothetical protein
MCPAKVSSVPIARPADIAEEFERTLRASGVSIAPGSALEAMTLELYRITEDRERPFTPEASREVPLRYAKGLGLAELAGQLIAVREHPAFPRLHYHLSLLNEASAPQNMRSRTFDDAANKVFELLVACWLMHLTEDVEIERPGDATRNPDILARINGRLWGVACKTPYSLAPDSLFENVQKGCEQLTAAGVATGIIYVNARNLIDHQRYWFRVPEGDTPDGAHAWSTFLNGQEPYDMLLAETQEIWNAVARARGEDVLKKLFKRHRTVVPGIAAWSQVAAGVVLDGTARASVVQVGAFSFVRKPPPWQMRVLNMIKGAASKSPPPKRERTA